MTEAECIVAIRRIVNFDLSVACERAAIDKLLDAVTLLIASRGELPASYADIADRNPTEL